MKRNNDCYEAHAGNDAVSELLGGSPLEVPDRYLISSPIEMLPLGVRQLIMHGTLDDGLPVELASEYARLARTAGDEIDFIEVPEAGHMDYFDTDSKTYALFYKWLTNVIPSY